MRTDVLEFTNEEKKSIDYMISRNLENLTSEEVALYAEWQAMKAMREAEFVARNESRKAMEKAQIESYEAQREAAMANLDEIKEAALARLEAVANG